MDPIIAQALAQLTGTGVVGILLVLSLFALRAKDKELSDVREAHTKALAEKDRQNKVETDARVEDSKGFNTLAMQLQREVISAVNKLGEMLEYIERRDRGEAAKRGEKDT